MGGNGSVFGFGEFLAALALLVLVYTASDQRYRFRIAVAPIPLLDLTFWAIITIGSSSLLLDVWYAEGWPKAPGVIGQPGLQAILGGMFLSVLIVWIVFAYLWPPTFGRTTAAAYARALYRSILKGDDTELGIVADELGYSASSIVRLCPERRRRSSGKPAESGPVPRHAGFAHDILLLIANRKFCRQVVRVSPVTVIRLFEAMTEQKKYAIPVDEFAKNIVTEALIAPDSIIYHESEEFSSDLLGYTKPFSKSVFGNYELVETLAYNHGSPTDILFSEVWDFNAKHYRAYGSCVLILLNAYLSSNQYGAHSYSLIRSLDIMQRASSDIYQIDEASNNYYKLDEFERLNVAVDFVRSSVKLIEESKRESLAPVKYRREEMLYRSDIREQIADLIYTIIFDAAGVRGDPGRCWAVHHNAVWADIFGLNRGPAWKDIHRRLARRIHKEIQDMDRFPNYKSARILGLILNVVGVKRSHRNTMQPTERAIQFLVQSWFRRRFLEVRQDYPDVAEWCLLGSITYDEEAGRLVKTYAKGTLPEPNRAFMQLDRPCLSNGNGC